LTRKGKGDLAELKIACDLVRRGYQVAIPFGEDVRFDLIVHRGQSLQRVQVKHGASRGGVLVVRCRTQSLTNGRVRNELRYTAATIDWLAVWDSTTDRCFYVPASELGSGRYMLHLRLAPARNGQVAGTRHASNYTNFEINRGGSR
jgi:PD-(D/E)XK endonuclease